MSLTSYRAAPPRAKSCVFKKEHPAEYQTGANASKNVLTRPLYWCNVTRRPGSDLLSRALRQSTIGAADFHGRVRNGIGWGICAITTWSSGHIAYCITFIRRHPIIWGFKLVTCIIASGTCLYARSIKPIEQLVPVSFTHYCASTPGLSTWWSPTVLKRLLVSRGASRLDAFSSYPFRT